MYVSEVISKTMFLLKISLNNAKRPQGERTGTMMTLMAILDRGEVSYLLRGVQSFKLKAT